MPVLFLESLSLKDFFIFLFFIQKDVHQFSFTLLPPNKGDGVFSTQTTSSLEKQKHVVNNDKMIHQLENRDSQSGGYCQLLVVLPPALRKRFHSLRCPQITA